MSLTLLRQGSPLAEAAQQLRILESRTGVGSRAFEERLREYKLSPLRAAGVEVLQLNLGKVCNQSCAHCRQPALPLVLPAIR
jgi:hypothetical protein